MTKLPPDVVKIGLFVEDGAIKGLLPKEGLLDVVRKGPFEVDVGCVVVITGRRSGILEGVGPGSVDVLEEKDAEVSVVISVRGVPRRARAVVREVRW